MSYRFSTGKTALSDSPDNVKARLEDHWKDDAKTGNNVTSLPSRR